MKQSAPVNKIALSLSWLAAVILVLLPVHAFITVWLSSATGHYTALRLWKEFLLVPVTIGAAYILLKDKALLKRFFGLLPVKLIFVYALLMIICAFSALAGNRVTPKAMWYGLLVDLRFLVFFLAVMVLAARSGWLALNWRKILLGPAVIVTAFAILQYLALPYDFLKHFGYGPATISPYETINHNLSHIRVASTLRGANPLGAYLILIISAAAAISIKQRAKKIRAFALAAVLLPALFFSFSRSAWIGTALSLLFLVLALLNKKAAKKIFLLGFSALLILGSVLAIVFRDNTGFENIFYHTDHASLSRESSNEGHITAFKNAGSDIVHEPLGRGVGTAGPASAYNYGHYMRIAENYFLQLGQEGGLLGMFLFLAITFTVGKMLWDNRADALAAWLFASLIGIIFINLLSHAWTDETLAYIWWGMAGITLGPAILTDRHKLKNAQKIKTAP